MRTTEETGGPAAGLRWLVRRRRCTDPVASLYCFPHAGGSPGEYVRWSDDLPTVQVWGVQLPGRAARLGEQPFTRMTPLVEAIAGAVTFDRPFALFGHSLGGLVAFEVARALRDRGHEPDRLFLSSCPAPPLAGASRRAPVHVLPDAALLTEIERRWGRLPAAVHADPALRAQALRCFRADIEVFETYTYVPGEPLSCPMLMFAGDQERGEFPLDEWRRLSNGPFELRFLRGHHFYLRQRRSELLQIVAETLRGDQRETTAASTSIAR